jgi:hypothetical protein
MVDIYSVEEFPFLIRVFWTDFLSPELLCLFLPLKKIIVTILNIIVLICNVDINPDLIPSTVYIK